MSRLLTNHNEITYRVVLLAPDSKVLVLSSAATGNRLPRFVLRRWRRPAEQIQAIFAAKWCLRVIVLDFLIDSECDLPCAIVQLLSPYPWDGLTFASANSIGDNELTAGERLAIEAICVGDSGTRGPFSRIGWLFEVIDWIRDSGVGDIDIPAKFQQYNAGGFFALVRFETREGNALWLKATGEPNRQEFDITSALSTICPNYLPEIVAMRQDWNAWIMKDAGEPLTRDADVTLYERVLIAMAEVQKETIDHTSRLISAGAFHQSLAVLRQHTGEMIDYFRHAMEGQISTKVSPLDERRLSEIESMLVDACDAMEKLEIPDTILHNDLNLGNILLSGDSPVFTDWCEVCVANPCFVPLQFLSRLSEGMANRPFDRQRLINSYKRSWHDVLSPEKIERAFTLAPLLAIASYLYGRGDLFHSARRFEPSVQSYARALARHMDRVIQSPSFLGAL